MMKKRCLITGCAGFIGFHTAIALAAQGHEVIGIDNFNSYYDVNLKLAREKELKRRGIDIIHGDICDEHLLPRVVEQFSFTHLIHLAAQAGVRYSLLNPQAYVEANIKGFTTILEFVKSRPEIKLCYASSSSVYGLNTKVPYSVHDSTDRQASFYGVTKKANELMAATYHHLFGISCIGMRFFTVYGPWGRPDMALYSFTQAILQNQPIKVYNFGKMSRDFTYIDDIVCGILAVLDYQGTNELFNLGGHKPVELLYFVELLEKALGMKATIDLAPLQSGDILSTYADITESQEKLGFYPKTSIEEGIPKFVEWYKEYAKGGT